MSAKEARKVVSKAVMDETFRNLLFSNPDKALADYELTEDEVSALRAIPAETIDDFANNLEERISMSFLAAGIDAMGGVVAGEHDAMGGVATGGSEAMGAVASGGQDALGSVAAGDADAMGAVASGGQDALSGVAMGDADAYGNYDAMGSADALGNADATGAQVLGDQAMSSDSMGADAAGAQALGDQAMGADVMGADAEGQLAFGAEGSEGIGESRARWFDRLAEALGFRGASGGGGKGRAKFY